MPKPTPDSRELRRFGLTTSALIAILFGLVLPWLFHRPYPSWPWIVAVILSGWALLLPASLGPVYRLWMAIGHGLGWINSRIILGIMFYVLILPIGFILRLLGKDPMQRRFDQQAKSYRVPSKTPPKDHVERPF
jgi:hypothetical protein